jgi:hypothetical protein
VPSSAKSVVVGIFSSSSGILRLNRRRDTLSTRSRHLGSITPRCRCAGESRVGRGYQICPLSVQVSEHRDGDPYQGMGLGIITERLCTRVGKSRVTALRHRCALWGVLQIMLITLCLFIFTL